MTIVLAIIMFLVIIIVHEFGHFTAAKLFGMRVHEFSIGMGPRLFSIRGKKTLYSIKLLPIGGSVQLDENITTDDPTAFPNKPVWQRFIVIAAGAVMNLVLGLIVCFIGVGTSGRIVTHTIKGFRDGAVTNQYLMADDEILSVNGHSVWTATDISYALSNKTAKETENGASFDFTVRRGGEVLTLDNVTFATREGAAKGDNLILDFYVYTEPLSFGNVISESFGTFATESRLLVISIFDLITGSYGINDLSGPVGVVTTMNTAVTTGGLASFLLMFEFITINVGIFNLLPIPALDGARLLFLIIEGIRRKPIKAEHEGIVHFAGFVLLMLLMLVVTFNDIVRLITGG